MGTQAVRPRLFDLTNRVTLTNRPNNAPSLRAVHPNVHNRMLMQEQELFRKIDAAGGLQKMACPGAVVYDKPPYLVMPPNGVPVQEQAALTLPAGAGNNVVVQWRVPTGYDGVLTSLVNLWTGGAGTFVDGSGDIVWRVQINRRYPRNYGNIITTLGSLTTPCQLFRGGLRIYSGELLTYMVNHAANAGLTGGNVICAFLGYIYPLG